MKKGRRQIVEKNIFQSQGNMTNLQQPSQQQQNSRYLSHFQNYAINTPIHQIQNPAQNQHIEIYSTTKHPAATHKTQSTKDPIKMNKSNVEDKISISPNSEIKKETECIKSTIQLQNKQINSIKHQNKINEDDKKSKIQMLKQKYLKKNSQNKNIPDNKLTSTIIQQQNKEKEVNTTAVQNVNRAAVSVQPNKVSAKATVLNFTKATIQQQKEKAAQNQIHKKSVKATALDFSKRIQKDESLNTNQIQIHNQKIHIKNQEKQAQQIQLSQIAKKEQKNQFHSTLSNPPNYNKKTTKSTVPPPPPKIISKKQINGQTQQPSQVNLSVELNTKINTKQPNTIQNHHQIQHQLQQPKVKSSVPPPPPRISNNKSSNLVNQILAKRLKKAQAIEQIKKEQLSYGFGIKSDMKGNQIKQPNIVNSINNDDNKRVNNGKDELLDEQYKQRLGQQERKQVNNSVQPQLNFKQLITRWINSPIQIIESLLPKAHLFINHQNQTSQKIYFQSKNSSYSHVLNNFFVKIVFTSKAELSEEQKVALHQFALEFYYSDPKYLTPQFLLILLKLGPTFMTKYLQFFKQDNIESYFLSIIQNKQYFLKEELQNFINLIIQIRQLNKTEYFYLLLITPSQKLLSISIIKQNNANDIILLLSIIKLIVKQNNNLIGVYLKYLNLLIDHIHQDYGQVQLIMTYIQQLKVNEKHYQLLKDIKLKLINCMNRTQSTAKKPEEEKKQSGGGFMGYFNKAVDKLKTATNQLTEVINQKDKIKSGPTKPEEKEKQDEIIYDPVLKRYLINGKVPDDEQTTRHEGQTKLPSPPPPPKSSITKSNNPIVPPPPPGKKSRVINNRYA